MHFHNRWRAGVARSNFQCWWTLWHYIIRNNVARKCRNEPEHSTRLSGTFWQCFKASTSLYVSFLTIPQKHFSSLGNKMFWHFPCLHSVFKCFIAEVEMGGDGGEDHPGLVPQPNCHPSSSFSQRELGPRLFSLCPCIYWLSFTWIAEWFRKWQSEKSVCFPDICPFCLPSFILNGRFVCIE